MRQRISFIFILGGLLALTACGSDDDSGSPAFDPNAPVSCEGETYCPYDRWLCRPGSSNNACKETQTATVFAADGSQSVETLPKTDKAPIDCFYVYPTVALADPVGNVKDFSNVDAIKVPLRAQAIPFSEVCEVYAPFYHQTSLATFGAPDREQYQEIAYKDVEEAFQFYLDHYNHGRKFVVLGHSQGAIMLRMLLQRRFDDDAALRSRMLIALTVGPVNDVTVPEGKLVGGSFKNIPLCSTREELGCVVAYDSVNSDGVGFLFPPVPGAACVNPVNFGADKTPLRKAYIPTKKYAGQFTTPNNPDLDTTFSALPDMYSGQCVRAANGSTSFRIFHTPKAGDTRPNLIDFGTQLFHILDYSFALPELIDLVKTRASAK
jgi:hypothetical protein